MCEPISAGIAAGIGALTSIYGTIQASKASTSAANAITAQNQATTKAQNEGFTSRLTASLAQTAAQSAASQETLAARDTSASNMRTQQMEALKNYQDTINAENAQAEALRKTGDTAAQDLLSRTSGTALTDAQTAQQQQAAELLNPSLPQGPEASDPSGGNNAVTSDTTAQNATARRTAEAATNIRNYGAKIGKVSSYDAPINTTNLAVTENKTGIMPAQTADYLLRSGSNTRLLPTQVQYNAATGLGQAMDTLLQSKGQSALDTASLSYGNATDIANLTQSDAETIAKNVSTQAQANAAAQKSQAGIISGVGNLGLYGAGYFGGDALKETGKSVLSGISSIFNPTTASNVTNHGA